MDVSVFTAPLTLLSCHSGNMRIRTGRKPELMAQRVCVLSSRRRVNKGKREASKDPAEIKRLCLQWLWNYNGSGYISTVYMVGMEIWGGGG